MIDELDKESYKRAAANNNYQNEGLKDDLAKKENEYQEKKENMRRKQLNGWNTVDLELDQKKKIKRYESLIKKLEFEAKVQKEVIEIRTNQLHDAEARIIQLEDTLKQNNLIGTHNSSSSGTNNVVPKTITTQQQQYEEEEKKEHSYEEESSHAQSSNKNTSNKNKNNIGETGLRNLLHVSQIKLQEQQKERQLDQNEVLELRNQISGYIEKLEGIEHENLTLKTKIQELTTILKLQRLSEDNGHDVYKELHTKTNLIVDLRSKNDLLSKQIIKLDISLNKLTLESNNYKDMILELNNILSPNVNTSEVQNIIDTIKKGQNISKEHAQILTIQHLKSQVETLEDEKMSLTNEINTLLYEQQQFVEAQQMMEHNNQQHQQMHQQQHGVLPPRSNSVPINPSIIGATTTTTTTGTSSSLRSSFSNFLRKI